MKPVHLVCTALLMSLTTTLASAQEPPSYSKKIGPFFHKYCVECHNAKKPSSGLNLETYKSLMEGGEHGPAIVPGKADDSRLVQMLEGTREPKMPTEKAERHPKKEEIALVRAWVEAGAKLDQEVQKTILPAIQSKVHAAPPVTALAYLPDGKHLIAGCYKDMFLCDTVKGKLVGKLEGLPQSVTALALNKQGDRLAVALGQPGTAAKIFLYPVAPNGDRTWGQPLQIAETHGDVIHQLSFSPDGKMLISVGYDRLVKIWDSAEGKNLKSLKEHSDSVYGVAFRAFASGKRARAKARWCNPPSPTRGRSCN
jgi:hypothetical protein